MIREFPPVEAADENGLLAYGGDLEVASLELAYRGGIFPWPSSEFAPVLWFAPPERAVLDFSAVHVPRRLARDLKKARFEFAVSRSFEEVITACANSPNRRGDATWITGEMISAYIDFHKAGFAQSFEAYNAAGDLVGGMYGVLINNYFAGESMFYRETNASKFALLNAVDYLKRRGLTWMDIQMLTPLLRSFGAVEIPRAAFMARLRRALAAAPAGMKGGKGTANV